MSLRKITELSASYQGYNVTEPFKTDYIMEKNIKPSPYSNIHHILSRNGRISKENAIDISKENKAFANCLTFFMYSNNINKFIKIKLFQTGLINLSSLKNENKKYLYNFIDQIKIYMSKLIKVSCKRLTKPNLLTYSSNVFETDENDLRVHIYNLQKHILSYMKTNLKYRKSIDYVETLDLDNDEKEILVNYIDKEINDIRLLSCLLEIKSTSLNLQFDAKTTKKQEKKIKVTIYPRGSIKISSAPSEEDVYRIYEWLKFIFQNKMENGLILNINGLLNNTDEVSDCSGVESIYDSDL